MKTNHSQSTPSDQGALLVSGVRISSEHITPDTTSVGWGKNSRVVFVKSRPDGPISANSPDPSGSPITLAFHGPHLIAQSSTSTAPPDAVSVPAGQSVVLGETCVLNLAQPPLPDEFPLPDIESPEFDTASPSFWERLIGAFTAKGQMRKCYLVAWLNRSDPKLSEKLEKAVRKVLCKTYFIDSPKTLHHQLEAALHFLIEQIFLFDQLDRGQDLLAFLRDTTIRNSKADLPSAQATSKTADKIFPSVATLLRAKLIQRLYQQRSNNNGTLDGNELWILLLKEYLGDAWLQKHIPQAFREATTFFFMSQGANHCRQILLGPSITIQSNPCGIWLESLRILCSHHSELDMTQNNELIRNRLQSLMNGSANDIHPALKARAYYLFSILREYEGKFDAFATLEALRLSPNSITHRTMLVKRFLVSQDFTSAKALLQSAPGDPYSRFLTQLMTVMQAPGISELEKLTDMMHEISDHLTPFDERLIAAVCKNTVHSLQIRDRQEVSTLGRLAATWLDLLHTQSLPWAVVRKYEGQIADNPWSLDEIPSELIEDGFDEVPEAQDLLATLRLLHGTPHKITNVNEGKGCRELSILELLLTEVLNKSGQDIQQSTLSQEELAHAKLYGNNAIDWFARFPFLQDMATLLRSARLILGEATPEQKHAAIADLEALQIEAIACDWAHWIRCLILSGSLTPDRFIRHYPYHVSNPIVEWVIDRWYSEQPSCYHPPQFRDLALPTNQHKNLFRLRRTRHACKDTKLGKPDKTFKTKGKLPLEILVGIDLQIESNFARARNRLQRGECDRARELFTKVLHQKGASALLLHSWTATVNYWIAVSMARLDDEYTPEAFSVLFDGPQAAVARSQVALWHIKKGALDDAEAQLQGLPERLPAAWYARTLLMHRRGQHKEALAEIQGHTDLVQGTGYQIATDRLKAAILERTGHKQEAREAYRHLREEYPHDPVVMTRWARNAFEIVYHNQIEGNFGEDNLETMFQLADSLPAISSSGIPWWDSYQPLARFLCQIHGFLDEPNAESATNRDFKHVSTDPIKPLAEWARVQLICRHFLSKGLIQDCWKTICNVPHTSAPPEFVSLKLTTSAWNLLKNRPRTSQANSNDRLRDTLSETAQSITELNGAFPHISTWKTLLGKAQSLVDGKDDSVWQPWTELPENHLMHHLPSLWSPDLQVQQQAAQCVHQQLIDADPGPEAPTATMAREQLLHFLVAWCNRNNNQVQKHYVAMEDHLDQLPLDGTDLWLAAAVSQYQQKRYAFMVERDLPDCIAELTDPRVNMLIASASVRTMVDCMKKRPQQSQKFYSMAMSCLTSILLTNEETDPQ